MSALTDAWQAALAGEHQAVFGYALLGPHLRTSDDVSRARDYAEAHSTLRDATAAAIAASGAVPRDPEADYPALYPVRNAFAARRLALRLEHEAAAAWRYLYAVAADVGDAEAATARAVRPSAQAALTESAVRAVWWRGEPVPFPGI